MVHRGSLWFTLGFAGWAHMKLKGPCSVCDQNRDCRYRLGVGEHAGKVACSTRKCLVALGIRDEEKERLAKASRKAEASNAQGEAAGALLALENAPATVAGMPPPLPLPPPPLPPPTPPLLPLPPPPSPQLRRQSDWLISPFDPAVPAMESVKRGRG